MKVVFLPVDTESYISVKLYCLQMSFEYLATLCKPSEPDAT